MKKTLTILKSLIDPEISAHFDDEFDITDIQTDYEFSFKFKNQGEEYSAFIMFRVEDGEYHINYINDIQVIDKDGHKYSVGNDEKRQEENQLIISTKGQNPNKPTVQEDITAIIEKEEQKLEERRKHSKEIEDHKDWMDLNIR